MGASLVTNEVIDSQLRRKEKGVLGKLDIKKAYDHLSWEFILKVLKTMGFGPNGLTVSNGASQQILSHS